MNLPDEAVPGYPGMVVREAEGRRVLEKMIWGLSLPQRARRPASRSNRRRWTIIADLSSFMWKFIAGRPENRCIIPVTEFAEAEGQPGSKTRTWFRVKDEPIFAWAGMWKMSDEWGPVYSGADDRLQRRHLRPVHDRMPVLLMPGEYDRWLHGGLDEVVAFQDRCFPDELIEMERTADPWLRKRPAPEQPSFI